METKKIKEILIKLEDNLRIKEKDLSSEDGSYNDSNLENGTYATGYKECLIDIYKELPCK